MRHAVGYQDPELIEVVFRKTLALRDGDPQPLDSPTCRIALGLMGQPRTVLDFGGACGATYFRLRPLLDWKPDWHVVETPMMAARATELGDQHLHFHASMPDMRPDLVVASGVLQYTPDPLESLKRILGLRPRAVVITRTACADRPVSFEQRTRLSANGPGPLPPGFRDREVSYVVRAPARKAVEALLAAQYLVRNFDEAEAVASPRFGPSVTTFGWLAVSRDAGSAS